MLAMVPRLRSALFVPAIRRDFLDKVAGRGTDAVVIDLEDAVPAELRPQARTELARWLALPQTGLPKTLVRINGLDEGCVEDDLEAAVAPALLGIQLPKVRTKKDIKRIDAALTRQEKRAGIASGTIRIWPLLETARAVHDAYEIATCSPRIAYMGSGASPNGDLARSVGLQHTGTYLESLYILSKVLLDVRAAGVPNPMSFMPTAFGDPEVNLRHARFMRSLGYDGALMIHPSQIAPANEVFGVNESDLAEAQALIRAVEEAAAKGLGAITFQGKMVDKAHLETARELVAKAAQQGK